MCNSFNARPCRYPYHCCNVVLMPPCILQTCKRQLVIHLIYSTRPAVDQGAPRSRRVDGQNTAHGRTLSSIRCSEVISGWFVIVSQAKQTSLLSSCLQPQILLLWRNNMETHEWKMYGTERWWFVKRYMYRLHAFQLISIRSIFYTFNYNLIWWKYFCRTENFLCFFLYVNTICILFNPPQ